MANFFFNVALGRWAELYNRVDTNDPAASTLVIMALATAGIEADSVLRDKDTFADVLSGATNEVTNTNYARKVLTDADLGAFAPDDTNDRVEIDIADQTFATILAGDGWSKIVIGYDPSSSGVTNSVIVPMFAYDYVATPDGTSLVVQINASGLARATGT